MFFAESMIVSILFKYKLTTVQNVGGFAHYSKTFIKQMFSTQNLIIL